MIGRLRGILIEKNADRCLLDVGGVGYEVAVSLQSLQAIPPVGEEAMLQIHTHVREDQLALFGFASDDEKRVFELLLGVSGIGPKLAMAVLSGLPLAELLKAIRDSDLRRLTTIPGVGKKLAERIALELRDKVALLGIAVVSSATAGAPLRIPPRLAPLAGLPAILGDVASMLTNLGFKRERAETAALALSGREAEGLDALVRAALRTLGGSP